MFPESADRGIRIQMISQADQSSQSFDLFAEICRSAGKTRYFPAFPILPPQVRMKYIFLFPINGVFSIHSLTICGILQA
jgi:hypothetical protein